MSDMTMIVRVKIKNNQKKTKKKRETVHVDLKKKKDDANRYLNKKTEEEKKIKYPLNLSFPFVVDVELNEYVFEYFQVSFLHVNRDLLMKILV